MRKWRVDNSLGKFRILDDDRDIGISIARKTDALLISAAPDMLEMLIIAKAKIHLMRESAGWDGGSAEAVIDQINDVIRKAKVEL